VPNNEEEESRIVKKSVRKYPETELDGPFIINTGRTRIVTSYTTFEEMSKHKDTARCKYLGSDMATEGPVKSPYLVYRTFEVCGTAKRRKK
jgi:hypothetical protein